MFRSWDSANGFLQASCISFGGGSSHSNFFVFHISWRAILACIVATDARPGGSNNLEMFDGVIRFVWDSLSLGFTGRLMVSVVGFHDTPTVDLVCVVTFFWHY